MTVEPKKKPARIAIAPTMEDRSPAWQIVETGKWSHTQRMPIAGGHLYLHIYDTAIDDGGQQRCMVFVPHESI